MSEVRVFELAKELKMPAKQLLSKMRKAGIPVTGNFSEMSVEQAEIVRKMAKSAKGIVVPESVKRTTTRPKKPSKIAATTKNRTAKAKLPSIANLIELIPKQTPINVNTLGKMYLVLFTETTLNFFFSSIYELAIKLSPAITFCPTLTIVFLWL